jgi:fermentation-respiration switch protein FrsA (DUF1100 family)
MKGLLRVIVVALALLGGTFVLVRCASPRLMYPAPPRPTSEVALGPRAERVWLESEGGRTEAILLPAESSHEPATALTPLVIYAHGNGELIDYWVGELDPLSKAGVSILLVEYPGYGRSSGTPSEASIQRAMVAAFDWAAARPGVDRTRIIGWGRSLGGGAVCALARERPLAALVLESTFTSMRAMAKALFRVPGFLVRDAYDNLEVVRGFRGPILQLHGDRDQSIPLDHARALHAVAARSELHVLPCGHNDCAHPWELLAKFIHAQ